MSRAGSVLKNVSYLAAAEVSKPILSFLFILLVSRRLGPEGVGAYAIILTFTALFELIATVGLGPVFVRSIAADRAQLPGHLNGALGAALVSSAGLMPAMWLLLRAFDYPQIVTDGIQLLSYTLLAATIQQYVISFCEALQNMRLRAGISLLDTLGRLTAGTFMLLMGYGVLGIVQGMVAARLVSTGAGMYLLCKSEPSVQIDFRQAWSDWPRLLRAGLPFLLMTISSTMFWSVNTLMLSKLGDVEQVGLYSAASRITDVLKNVFYSYLIVLLPMMSDSFAKSPPALKQHCDNSLRYLTMASMPVSTGVSILAPRIIALMYGDKFEGAAAVLTVLVWTVCVFAVVMVFARVLVASHNHMLDLYCNFAALALNTALGSYLIPRHGPVGAGLATLIALVAYGLMEYAFVAKWMFRPTFGLALARSVIACGVMGAALFAARRGPLWLLIPGAALLYGWTLILLRGLNSTEVETIRSLAARGLRWRPPFLTRRELPRLAEAPDRLGK